MVDTHALAWIGVGDARLTPAARNAILDVDEQILVSAVTAYEFIDLNCRGRFRADLPFAEIVAALRATVLDFPAGCAVIAGLLPPHHLDPVDRMLVAHALHADLPIMTADAVIARYPVRIVW